MPVKVSEVLINANILGMKTANVNAAMKEDEMDEHPEWFSELKADKTPCVGKEIGFIYLSKKGWDDNKEKIKKAFMSSKKRRGSWEQFEEHALKHFERAEKRRKDRIKILDYQLIELLDMVL